jgi:hypothetical protein
MISSLFMRCMAHAAWAKPPRASRGGGGDRCHASGVDATSAGVPVMEMAAAFAAELDCCISTR